MSEEKRDKETARIVEFNSALEQQDWDRLHELSSTGLLDDLNYWLSKKIGEKWAFIICLIIGIGWLPIMIAVLYFIR